MLVTRPARPDDLDAICHLAELAGPGFTSLAVGREALSARLNKSVASFEGRSSISPNHVYLLMLEDMDKNEIVGMSAVKAQVGIQDPFFNFRILKVAQKSAVTGSRFDMEVLVLVNEYAGATEVGSLFIKDGYRGSGAGRLISQSRYMLIAADCARFGEQVISELRGRVSEAGESPFWDAIGRKFFRMDFHEADKISAEKDNQFILDLMPKHPIYVALLPDAAKEVIGKTHPAGVGARRYLEAEGFRYDGNIDIFDAGPSLSVPRDDLTTVKDSRLEVIHLAAKDIDLPLVAMVSNDSITDFRCVLTNVAFIDNKPHIEAKALENLNLSDGDTARIWIKR
ncbi:arginine N-succinyltransferase [Hellea balneolensis]|uniref:arginine N-succinyltransferase n=1 Tax=Hellea balneolensis TaxID=287478 RepID=UPI0003FB0D22|nr:arginine N-succinyltransferase [Hellea balneolensis]